MVDFAGNINVAFGVWSYEDQNPNLPPTVGRSPLDDRGAFDSAALTSGSFQNLLPSQPPTRDYGGDQLFTYFNDYYNRVWMIPTTVDFGPLTATTSKQVFLWNAHLFALTLEEVNVADDPSLSIVGLSTGVTFDALGGTFYYIYANGAGQPVINDAFTFTFDPVEVVRLPVVGIRSRLWKFPPNWSSGFEVSYEFRTEIITSDSGKEQRQQLRQTPRKSFSFESVVHERDWRDFVTQMNVWQGRSTIVPDFSKYARLKLATIEGQGFMVIENVPDWMVEGALVVLMYDGVALLRTVDEVSGETVALTSDLEGIWPADVKVYQGVSGRLAPSLSVDMHTNRLATVKLSFDADPGAEVYATPPAAALTHRGREVFLKRPNWADKPQPTFESYLQQIDYGTGRIDNFLPVTFNTRYHKANYIGRNLQEAREVEEFYRRMAGQLTEFYMPTFTEDVLIYMATPATTSNLRIEGPLLARDMIGDTIHKDLIIFMEGGGYYIRTIQNIFEVDDTYGNDSVIQCDSPFPIELTPDNVRQICWMPLWRFATDGLTLSYITDEVSEFALNMRNLEYEANE